MERIGGRVPVAMARQMEALAKTSGRTESEILREAVGQYGGKHDPTAIRNTLEDVQMRLATVEQKLGRLGQLISG